MRYPKVTEGIFIHRENRFIAQVQIGEKTQIVHVRNTGRCKELLVPGVKVYLEDCSEKKRKTKYSLIGVEKKGLLINMDSQIPNRVVEEALVKKNIPFDAIKKFKRESIFRNSRFDFELLEPAGFMEVKGVTLEENKIAKFPDATDQAWEETCARTDSSETKRYASHIIFPNSDERHKTLCIKLGKGCKFFTCGMGSTKSRRGNLCMGFTGNKR